jgi:hypothetical protein
MDLPRLWAQYRDELTSDPLLVLALSAALVALATTPLAFAILGRAEWFKARRGRVLRRPEFSSIVIAMMLVMGIPAIFAALVIKSRSFDRNRYEFDPNRTWSVLEQGRGLQSLKEADFAVKNEMEHLALQRKNLVESVKKLDEEILSLRSVADSSPAAAQRLRGVLQSLAGVRKSVGLDGPQQLLGDSALPLEMRALRAERAGASAADSVPATRPIARAPAFAAEAADAATKNELSPAQIETELATVPLPQRKTASLLPLDNLPSGWTVGKLGNRHLETFSADNLYEKIDGRAESFVQYGVEGMAYAFYHLAGDESNELQLYIFQLADSLKALGKYGSEKPDDAKPVAIGDEGYTAAGSTMFHLGRYYTQIVSTQDDPKFAGFGLELANRVAARQRQKTTSAPAPSAAERFNTSSKTVAVPKPSSPTPDALSGLLGAPDSPSLTKPTPAETSRASRPAEVSPATLFALLPAQGRHGEPKYVAQDVFGYSFLSDVFLADYRAGAVTWQGFLRPYRDAEEAKSMLDRYKEGVKKDGAEVRKLAAEGADEIVISSNIGLVDVVFRKGNTLAGANGATSAAPAEVFARALAKSLPATLPSVTGGN